MSVRNEKGQMAVEFAITVPVMLALGFICLQALVFAGECVRFDMAFRNAVLLQADDGLMVIEGCADIARCLVEEGYTNGEVSVSCEESGLGHLKYQGTLTYVPDFLEGVTVFGVESCALTHQTSFVVSPHRKGVVI